MHACRDSGFRLDGNLAALHCSLVGIRAIFLKLPAAFHLAAGHGSARKRACQLRDTPNYRRKQHDQRPLFRRHEFEVYINGGLRSRRSPERDGGVMY